MRERYLPASTHWRGIQVASQRSYPSTTPTGREPIGLLEATDADHTRLRKAYSAAFSNQVLMAQESLVGSYVNKMITQLQARVADGTEVLDLQNWVSFCTFDIICALSFGEDFGCLDQERYHEWSGVYMMALVEALAGRPIRMLPSVTATAFLLICLFAPISTASSARSVSYRKRSDRLSFDKRRNPRVYEAIVGEVVVRTLAAAYPSIGKLFTVANAGQVARWAFRLNQNYCTSKAMSVTSLPAGLVSKALYTGLNSEHVIDKQVINYFIQAALSGYLSSGPRANLLPIPETFWLNVWQTANSALKALPPVGNPAGESPNTPDQRVMEAFGSNLNPGSLLATAAAINAAKGKIMGFTFPITIRPIEKLSAAAVKADSDEAVNQLLTAIRISFAVFEYFRDYRVVKQWNNVLQQVGLQCAHIEYVTGVSDLQNWWWLWAPDYFQAVENFAQGWATEAIRAAASAYIQARTAGRSLKTYDVVVAALSEFQSKIQMMKMPIMDADKTTITD
ncbi:uncharacterized protein BO97DRAFT_428310 [Aspergillus homomorphus CBS 101889]|uniref:Cytochrome P450 n=1 Tax=Aspergillus homomorphus (strain CBS 101889) TaxID=1450537 RepID=A0A395HQF7_ASPHC|nr:hypothetical protein BO97DRAFT_428310 [Aspergillus homomorphus CBS 101889]RAL08484.1 hypothetical protein BO97DRAFT_428310 [Aspergillus homomorphus CBS 101889]